MAFTDFRRDPQQNPLLTPSGKIEIFSRHVDLGNPQEIPAVPKYIQEWDSPFPSDNSTGQDFKMIYPLQAIGHHTLRRVHSTHDNNDWLEETFPQRVFINPLDAVERKIRDGDRVRVFNDRGVMELTSRVTPRIMPGVVDIPQGAWWKPDSTSVNYGGNVNVLTSTRWTPFAFGTAQQTIMVEVEKAVNV